MTLGPRRRLACTALALVLGPAWLTGCSDDPGSGSSGSAPSAGAEATTEPTAEATTEPTTEATPAEPTPTVEPATGLWMRMDNAELRMPQGWSRENNFGVPFLRQGSSDTFFGILTWTELNDAGTDKVAFSLDSIAKRQLRLLDNPRIKRLDDVVIGGDTMAYRLAGQDKAFYREYYGVLIGNYEYSIQFDFNRYKGTREEAIAIIESILATWDFNP